MFDNSSTIRPTTTIPCIVLLLDVLNKQVPWPVTLTYISCSSDFYTFYINIPLSLGCMIRKVSAEDIAIRGNGTGLEYMCPTRHFVYIFFNPVFQVSTAKNEVNLFNNHILIEAPVTFAPAGAMTPSAEFLFWKGMWMHLVKVVSRELFHWVNHIQVKHIKFSFCWNISRRNNSFSRKKYLAVYANYLQFTWNVKFRFLRKQQK